jgi:hypothetical protein
MSRIKRFLRAILVIVLVPFSIGQTAAPSQKPTDASPQKVESKPERAVTPHFRLGITESAKLADMDLSSVFLPVQCDQDGNFYSRNDGDFGSPLQKRNLQGELKAKFLASSSTDLPHLPLDMQWVGSVWATNDGEVYMEVMSSITKHEFLLFGQDGTYKSKITIDIGAVWHAKTFLVFDSGNLLIMGDKWDKLDKINVPFTAVFSSSGTLLKTINLEDDEQIANSTRLRDPKLGIPGQSYAVTKGAITTGGDGNVYLMRWLSPALFYVISPGGEVVRRFHVDPGDRDAMPESMRIAGNHIAVEFRNKKTKARFFKIVNLEGEEVAMYDWPEFGEGRLFYSVCYLQNPERLAFVGETKDGKPILRVAEPR